MDMVTAMDMAMDMATVTAKKIKRKKVSFQDVRNNGFS